MARKKERTIYRGPGQVTFRELDGDASGPPPYWALEHWYEEVRDIKIADMAVEHLARCLRQNLHIELVIPFALQALEDDPLAGEMYKGQLVQNLRKVTSDYWRANPEERARFIMLAQRAHEVYEKEFGDKNVKMNLMVTEDELLRR